MSAAARDVKRRKTNKPPVGPGFVSPIVTACHELTASGKMEDAGIAPEFGVPQVTTLHNSCVEHGCQWLQYVCKDAALR
jgi:hypothetical protein